MFFSRPCSGLILLLILQLYTAKAVAALTASAKAENQLLNHLFEALKVGVVLRPVVFVGLSSPVSICIWIMLWCAGHLAVFSVTFDG